MIDVTDFSLIFQAVIERLSKEHTRRYVPTSEIADYVYRHGGGPLWACASIRVIVHKNRARLAKQGWVIASKPGTSGGMSLRKEVA